MGLTGNPNQIFLPYLLHQKILNLVEKDKKLYCFQSTGEDALQLGKG